MLAKHDYTTSFTKIKQPSTRGSRVFIIERPRFEIIDKRAQRFERWQGLAASIAYSFSEKYNMPFGELLDEALAALGKDVVARPNYYDGTKAAESTWYYQSIYWDLKIYCDKRVKIRKREGKQLKPEIDQPIGDTWIQRFYREVEEEGKALLRALLDAPAELCSLFCNELAPTRSRNAFQDHLRDEGWTNSEIAEAWKQVDEVLADYH